MKTTQVTTTAVQGTASPAAPRRRRLFSRFLASAAALAAVSTAGVLSTPSLSGFAIRTLTGGADGSVVYWADSSTWDNGGPGVTIDAVTDRYILTGTAAVGNNSNAVLAAAVLRTVVIADDAIISLTGNISTGVTHDWYSGNSWSGDDLAVQTGIYNPSTNELNVGLLQNGLGKVKITGGTIDTGTANGATSYAIFIRSVASGLVIESKLIGSGNMGVKHNGNGTNEGFPGGGVQIAGDASEWAGTLYLSPHGRSASLLTGGVLGPNATVHFYANSNFYIRGSSTFAAKTIGGSIIYVTTANDTDVAIISSTNLLPAISIDKGIAAFEKTENLPTGTTTVSVNNAATIQFYGDGETISKNITFSNANTKIKVATADPNDDSGAAITVTYSSAISGTIPLNKVGKGVLKLEGTNTYTGGTVVTGGLVEFYSKSSNLGSGMITLNGGGLKWGSGSAEDISGSLNAIGSGGAVFNTNGNSISFGTVLTGTGSVIKEGAGTLTFPAGNSYTGGLVINGGAVSVAGASCENRAGHVITINNGGTLFFAGNDTWGSNYVGAPVTQIVVNEGGTVELNQRSNLGVITLTGGTMISTGGNAAGPNSGTYKTPWGAAAFRGVVTVKASDLPTEIKTTLSGFDRGRGSFALGGDATSFTKGSTTATFNVETGARLIVSAALADGKVHNGGVNPGGHNGSAIPSVLIKEGGGIMELYGTQAYTGETRINAGTLVFSGEHTTYQGAFGTSGTTATFADFASWEFTVNGNGSRLKITDETKLYYDEAYATTRGFITVNTGAIFELASQNQMTLQNAVSGAGRLLKTGDGTVTISGDKSYTGGTEITGGFILFTQLGNFGTGGITLNGGGLRWGWGTLVDISTRQITIGDNGGIFDTNSNSIALGGLAITGTGTLSKVGFGTLTLTAANAYTGGTSISAGKLVFADGALGTTGDIVLKGGELGFTAGNTTDISSRLVVGDGGGTLDIATDLTFASAVRESGSAGVLQKVGAGILTLDAASTFSGGILIKKGGVVFASGGLGSSGNITVQGGASLTWGANNTDDISSRLIMSPGEGSAAVINTGANDVTFYSTVSGELVVLEKQGSGALTFYGANTYTGGTKITAGSIVFSEGGLGESGDITVGNGRLVWGWGNTEDISARLSLTGGANAILDTGDNEVTLASGIGQTGGSGAILEKQGSGTLTLNGVGAYTGGTKITAGSVIFKTGTLGAIGSITVGNNARLVWGSNNVQDISARLVLAAGANAILDTGANDVVFASAVSEGGVGAVLEKQGSGSLTLNGSSTYTGGTKITAGSIIFVENALGTSNAITVQSGAALVWASGNTQDISSQLTIGVGGGVLDTNGNDVTLATDGISGSGTLIKRGSGTLVLSGDNSTFAGGISIEGGVLSAAADEAFGSGTLTLNGGTLDFTGSTGTRSSSWAVATAGGSVSVKTGTVAWGGALTGAGTFTKVDGGALTYSGNASGFTGTLVVADGELNVQSALGASGTFSAPISISSGASLTLTQNDPQTLSGAVSGNGTLQKFGTNALTVAEIGGTVSLTVGDGSLTLTGLLGRLADDGNPLTPVAGSHSGTIDVGATGLLTFAIPAATQQTLTGAVVGYGGQIAKEGVGVLALAGAAAFTSAINVNAGELLVGSERTLTGAVNVADGATIAGSGIIENISLTTNTLGGSGAIVAPNGVLTVGKSGTTTSFNGLTLRLALSKTGGVDSSDSVVVAGSATFAKNVKNRLDLSTTVNAVEQVKWTDGTYTVLRAVQGLEVEQALLESTTFLYRGVEISAADRVSATLVQSGNDLILTTFSGKSYDLKWATTGTSGVGVWAAESLAKDWEYEGGNRQAFQNGDLVNFGRWSGAATEVRVDTSGGGVIVGGMTIGDGMRYVFNKSGDGTAKIVGIATETIGEIVEATSRLDVLSGATAEFGVWIDFRDIKIAGTAVFADKVETQNSFIVTGTARFKNGADTSGVATMTNNGTIALAWESGGDDGVFATSVSGTGRLVKSGAGRVELGGANTHSGGTTVEAGVLALTQVGATGTGSVEVKAGAKLEFALTQAGAVTVALTGAGGVLVTGAQTEITTSVFYTGETVVDGGSLLVSASNALGNSSGVRVTNDGVLTLAAESALGATSVTVTDGGQLFSEGTQSISSLNIEETAGGADFGGANVIFGAARIGTPLTGVAVVQLEGTVFDLVAPDALADATAVILKSGNVSSAGDQAFAHLETAGATNIALGAGATLTVGAGVLAGGLTGANASLVKNGSDTLLVENALAHTGTTQIDGGLLKLTAANALAASSSVQIDNGGTLEATQTQRFKALVVEATAGGASFGGKDLTLGAARIEKAVTDVGTVRLDGADFVLGTSNALTASPRVILSAGSVTSSENQQFTQLETAAGTSIALDSGATLRLDSGTLAGGLTGADATLVKESEGILRLLPTSVNSHGDTLVTGGILSVSEDANLGGGTNTLDGGELRLDGAAFSKRWLVTENGGTVRVDVDAAAFVGGFADASAVPGSLTKSGAGELSLAASAAFTGIFTVAEGTVVLLTPDALAGIQELRVTGGSVMSENGQRVPRLEVEAGQTFAFDPALASPARVLHVDEGTVSGRLTGVSNLVKESAGALNLPGATAATPIEISGVLDVRGGELNIVLDEAGPVILASTVVFSPDSVLNIGGFFDGTAGLSTTVEMEIIRTSGAIATAGFPLKYEIAGSGNADFATAQITTGSGGRSILATFGLAWTDTHIADGGAYDHAHGDFTVEATFTVGSSLSDRTEIGEVFLSEKNWDGRTLTKKGAGALTLAGANTYTGATHVVQGRLVVNGVLGAQPAAVSSPVHGDYAGAIDVGGGSYVEFDTVGAQTLRGDISGNGTLVKRGTAAFRTLGAVNTGAVEVARGAEATFDGVVDTGRMSVGGTAQLRAAEETARVGVLEIDPGAVVEFSGKAELGAATVQGTVVFRGDTSVAEPFSTSGAERVELGENVRLTLSKGGEINVPLLGDTWTLVNQWNAESLPLTTSGIAGSIENAGEALVDGDVGGNALNASGGHLEIKGGIGGSIDNSGIVSVRGVVHGSAWNRAGAHLRIESERDRCDIRGELLNDGMVWFENLGQKLAVASLKNATADGVGRYSVELDFATPAFSDHVELAANGEVSGRHIFSVRNVLNAERATAGTRIELVRSATGMPAQVAADADIRLEAPLNIGLYRYDTASTGGSSGNHASVFVEAVGSSSSVESLAASAGTQAAGWYAQLDSLSKRFGELRLIGKQKKTAEKKAVPAENEYFWIRTYAQRANADLGPAVARFHEYQYGVDTGIDHGLELADGNYLHLGGFVGYQASRRRLNDAFASKGENDAPYLGAYGTWQHDRGWYVDGTLKAQYNDNSFDVNDTQGRDRASLDHAAIGASLEIGKSWDLWDSGLRLTPSTQLAWTHAEQSSTTTDRRVHANRDASDTIRWAVGGSLSRAFELSNGQIIQPSIRIGYEEQNSYGGALHLRYGDDDSVKLRPNTDGHRVTAGIGVIWQTTSSQQIHFDYECAWGSKYDTPWAFNASYRVRF
ncbi:MAG: autotransporter-associated beta strand repeat-containing protein [Puniceicoccales bacterium]|jgi:outer membrane autotransporter protein|nr:autotransporter-associated beta strand repeat-containing protein [Puniceicoccales bacterium]